MATSMNLTLIYPMFAQFLLTFLVLLIMFGTRVRAVREGRLQAKYFKTYPETMQPPDDVVKTQRHYANLFENPVLFYAGCLAAAILPVYGFAIQFWAWLFVAARAVHAFIHLGDNKIYPRMGAFGLGWASLLGLWLTIILKLAYLTTSAY